jgi:phage FluMu protein Com
MTTKPDTFNSVPKPRADSRRLTNWRCRQCGALLGRYLDHRMQITFARGHEFYVTLPVTTRCRRCKSLNELAAHPLS